MRGLPIWEEVLASGVKRCAICGVLKPASEFHKNRYSKDGLKAYCRPCNCAKAKTERDSNREAIAQRRRLVYASRVEEMRARDKARREREGEARRERKRLAYKANPEPMRSYVQRWRTERLEEVRRKAREYQKAHPDKQWARNATRRARVRNAPAVEKVDRRAIIERDRSVCGICGEAVAPKDIHLDHIVPLFLGGTHTAENLRVTHRLCNLSRKRVNDELLQIDAPSTVS
jgi:5-methylcytosine-specific restriction endonuclease McrA